jgi:hypothetical protein
MPVQQSADVVHVPPVGMHEFEPPHWLLMQGLPQQSALVAHAAPASGGVPPSVPVQSTGRIRQRGMPSASLAQQFSGLVLQ